ncbi:MAG TPA: hypothetical protein PKH07_08540, partial [bacterium]|nr:hypothetical protein [bacterium]
WVPSLKPAHRATENAVGPCADRLLLGIPQSKEVGIGHTPAGVWPARNDKCATVLVFFWLGGEISSAGGRRGHR